MRILVIRFSSLGDVVLAAAPLRALAERHPDAEITFATRAQYAPLFSGFPAPVQIMPLQPGQSLADFARALGESYFDLIVDLHASLRSRALTARLNAGKLRRIDKATLRRWRMVWSKKGLDRPHSVVRSYLEAAGLSGEYRPTLTLADSEQTRVLCPSRPILGLGWGARHPTKAVPPELWTRLLAALAPVTPFHIALFGLSAEEAAIARFVREDLHGIGGLTLETHLDLPLRELMVRLSGCAAFVSGDSGLMHLADALGVPTFGLFGPTHPALGFAPAGERSRAFHSGVWCSPCDRHGRAPCFRDRRYCFEELDVNAVADALSAALRRQMAAVDRAQ